MALYFEPARVVDGVIVRDAIGLRAYPVVGAEVNKVAIRSTRNRTRFGELLGIFHCPILRSLNAISPAIIKQRGLHLIGKNGVEHCHAFDSLSKSQHEQSKPSHAKRKNIDVHILVS